MTSVKFIWDIDASATAISLSDDYRYRPKNVHERAILLKLSSLAFSSFVLLFAPACTVEDTPASKSDTTTGGSAGAGLAKGGGTNSGTGGSAGIGPSLGGSAGSVQATGAGTANQGGSPAGGMPASGSPSTAASSAGTAAAIHAGGSAGTAASIHAGGSNSTEGGRSFAGSATVINGGSANGGSTVQGTEVVAKALPNTTFVFERRVGNGNDHLVAMDFVSLEQRVITTLAEPGSSVEGYKLDGVTVSPDRTRIVIASLYGPTAADVATGLATNRLWSLDTSGSDFHRLTPVFPNTHAGQTGWRIDVRDPAYSADGSLIVFDYGEGDFNGGYVAPWVTAADGSTLPSLIDTNLDCSVNGNAAFNPVTGDLLLAHVVCIGATPGGYYLYPRGGGAPDYLVNEKGVSMSSEPPAFSADGSIFVYSARTYSDNIQSLYAYIMSERRVVPLVLGAVDRDIVNATFAPDNIHMVYCVKEGDAYDLHLVDFGVDPPTDTALTNDGVSCDAVF
ncbi:MAG TPA: hypothetical protein VIV60_10020 [Polyangiaceae bacterium]